MRTDYHQWKLKRKGSFKTNITSGLLFHTNNDYHHFVCVCACCLCLCVCVCVCVWIYHPTLYPRCCNFAESQPSTSLWLTFSFSSLSLCRDVNLHCLISCH